MIRCVNIQLDLNTARINKDKGELMFEIFYKGSLIGRTKNKDKIKGIVTRYFNISVTNYSYAIGLIKEHINIVYND